MSKNPYEILGVEKTASEKQIKDAFRKLALQHHPDKGGDEEKFKEISQAYETLSDPTKRKSHDNPNINSHPGFGGGIDMSDMFGDIFGQRRNAKARGRDIYVNLPLTFIEAALGCNKPVSIDYPEICSVCEGKGAKAADRNTCLPCNGTGKITKFNGAIGFMHACNDCAGRGYKIKTACSNCNGQGQKANNMNYNVLIPAGIDNGSSIRLSGKGFVAEYGGNPGDLYLNIMVNRHMKFERNGLDIFSESKIDYVDCILGTSLEVDTIHGKYNIKVPKYTQADSILKINGKGISKDGQQGNHMIKIKVQLPKSLNEEQKELLEKLKK